jgi:hypothetical protein
MVVISTTRVHVRPTPREVLPDPTEEADALATSTALLQTVHEKMQTFITGFGSAQEFFAYCEGQGITGVQHKGQRCLVAEALRRLVGNPALDIRVSAVAIYVLTDTPLGPTHRLQRGLRLSLPTALCQSIIHFDRGDRPDLITPEKEPLC